MKRKKIILDNFDNLNPTNYEQSNNRNKYTFFQNLNPTTKLELLDLSTFAPKFYLQSIK